MKTSTRFIIATTVVLLVGGAYYFGQQASAGGIPEDEPMVYTGVLHDGGQPVNGTRNLEISLWNTADESAGSPVCSTRADSAEVTDGRFRVALSNHCTDAVRLNPDLWVEVRVDGGSLGRSKIGAVPYSVNADNGVPVGTVVPFAGPVSLLPSGWLLCDGSELRRDDYPKLFAAIGSSHGGGDGASTFHVPDYRGRFLRGVDHDAGNDPDVAERDPASDGGNSGDKVGSVQSAATARPSQNFTSNATGNHRHRQGLNGECGGFLKFGSWGTSSWRYTQSNSVSGCYPYTDTTGNHSHSIVGGGDSETRPRNAAVNYIIKY
jgi:hypothetical protein